MALATLVFYLAVGAVIAAILAVRDRRRTPAAVASFAMRLVLWPVFVPLLSPERSPQPGGRDEDRIRTAEGTLAEALRALGNVLGDGLGLEMRRVEALGKAMRLAARRMEDLNRLLAAPEHDLGKLQAELERHRANQDGSPVAEIVEQRIAHVRRIEGLRSQTKAELERALARAGELATRLALLRYDTGAVPTAATAQQLASSIDELCAVLSEVRAA